MRPAFLAEMTATAVKLVRIAGRDYAHGWSGSVDRGDRERLANCTPARR